MEKLELSADEMMEMAEETVELDEELDEMAEALSGSMTPEDLEQLKVKHRSDEARDILKADLKYLKALFDRLEQEKKQVSSGNIGQTSGSSESFSCVVDCIPDVEAVDVDVGSFVDACV